MPAGTANEPMSFGPLSKAATVGGTEYAGPDASACQLPAAAGTAIARAPRKGRRSNEEGPLSRASEFVGFDSAVAGSGGLGGGRAMILSPSPNFSLSAGRSPSA